MPPGSGVGWTYLAGLRQYEPAVEAFKRCDRPQSVQLERVRQPGDGVFGLERYKEAVEQYQRAFDLSPTYRTDSLINHEYGFVLVRLGDLDGAAATFTRMLAEKSTANQARGRRSMALLEMYRGRYGSAIDHLREAVVINKTNNSRVSEYRDRLYLASAYGAKGAAQPSAVELQAAHRLALDSTLAPEWLRRVGKMEARAGRVGEARTILTLMSKTAGDATAAASVNRNAAAERAHFDVVRGEIELAEGRAAKAVEFLQSAYVIDAQPDTLDSLAAALAAAGRLEDAARRYEELIVPKNVGNESQEQRLNGHVRLAEIYARLGRPDRARELCDVLLTQWKGADDGLVLVRDARKVLAGLK